MKEPTVKELLVKLGNFVAGIKNLVFSHDEKGWQHASDLEMELYKKAHEGEGEE